MMKVIFTLLFLVGAGANATTGTGAYYEWGQAPNGYGYCYEWAYGGGVLNGGQPIPYGYCEQVNPSYYSWARGNNGYTYCYQFTPQGWVLNNGAPVNNSWCY